MSPNDLPSEPQEGGEAELADFLCEHWEPLFKMINARVQDVHAANDIRQEVAAAFTMAWRDKDSLRWVDNHVAFLHGIANKKIMKYFRDGEAKFRALAGADEAEEDVVDPGAEDSFRAIEGDADLKRLPFHFRQAVWLVDILGYRQVEAAKILAISAGTLKSRLVKGREYASRLNASDVPVQIETAKEDTR
ncbi:sigma-70 family RNA polymerase sigma factor [Amycolatopsis sp. NPDC004625]|uniref:RNA polymerase sigma factor n=1 Tax=Amycolatopsis sp. NPDC004625 TaxID=3154670 RepID=UPI0033A2BEDE